MGALRPDDDIASRGRCRHGSVAAAIGLVMGMAVPACSLDAQGLCRSDTCGEPEASDVGGGDGGASDAPVTDSHGGDGPSPVDHASSDAPSCPSEDPESDPALVSDSLGVFVAPPMMMGSDANPGTMAMPFATVGAAVTAAIKVGKRSVFVCQGTYMESVTLSGASCIGIYGGFNCTMPTWPSGGGASAIQSMSAQGAIVVSGSSHVTVESMTLSGAMPAGMGASSIAASILSSKAVVFGDVVLTAPGGSNGAMGAMGNNYMPGPAMGGNNGGVDQMADTQTCMCMDGTTSTGGQGGPPTNMSGAAGTPALGGGAGGAAFSGGGGGNAAAAGPTSATGASVPGTLSSAGWAMATTGTSGFTPGPSQGGGGGGASGAYGGGGACGGCGGGGGGGGQSGGSSYALLAYASAVELIGCSLTAGNGGNGGNGSNGQDGQAGGTGGNNGATYAGGGGGGGGGSAGGGGGGGAGGNSAGVVQDTTSTVVIEPSTTIAIGNAGNGGTGGTGGSAGAAGGPGNSGSGCAPTGGQPGQSAQSGQSGMVGQHANVLML